METIIHPKISVLKSDYIDPTPEDAPAPPPASIKIYQFAFKTLGWIFPKKASKIAFDIFCTPRKRARHKISDALLEQARVFDVLYGGQFLKGYEWGTGEKTILLVHGWESRGTAMRSFVPALLEQGYKVVAMDGPAHGDSGWKRTNLVHFGGAVKAFLRQMGDVHAIIAHSFGGAASVFALNQEKNSTVQKLVLIGVPDSLKKVVKHYFELIKLTKNAQKYFLQHMETLIGQPLVNVDLSKAGPKTGIKDILIVHDRYDKVVPVTSAQSIAEHWDEAHLMITEGYGHYRLMKNPDVVNYVTQFIVE